MFIEITTTHRVPVNDDGVRCGRCWYWIMNCRGIYCTLFDHQALQTERAEDGRIISQRCPQCLRNSKVSSKEDAKKTAP